MLASLVIKHKSVPFHDPKRFASSVPNPPFASPVRNTCGFVPLHACRNKTTSFVSAKRASCLHSVMAACSSFQASCLFYTAPRRRSLRAQVHVYGSISLGLADEASVRHRHG
eukprot:3182878-Pleurochrysis_carterae.AAC.2